MYPDLITPHAHPDLLSRVDYDPYNQMPDDFAASPRVFATATQLTRARHRIADGVNVDTTCFAQLIEACKLDEELPELGPPTKNPDWGGPLVPWLNSAFLNALAYALTDDNSHLERSLEAMRLAVPVVEQTTDWNGNEHNEGVAAARAYDLLVATGLSAEDDVAFRQMLHNLIGALDHGDHRHCNNHNSMDLIARQAIGIALGDRQTIHDVFYGCERNGPWRYGFIHLMRHDFLADGVQWEGTMGYHMLVLNHVLECFGLMENIGVDLWHREWTCLRQNDGFDEHRGWGPKGAQLLNASIDVLLYQTFPNGDYSGLHDQGLGNLRGTIDWWPLFPKVYEIYQDPRYAWAVWKINDEELAVEDGPIPAWFQGNRGMTEFVRSETRSYPMGDHPFKTDVDFSLVGKHVSDCSIFPVQGSAMMRSDAMDEGSLSAYFYWGPHWAGHRSPAALHLDIHNRGEHVTIAPHLYKDGFAEPLHLSWVRTTVAHNTVVVDEKSMFPYDFPSESLWEYDHWRDTISDGTLEQFDPEGDVKIVRASNDNVYAGVVLDRTVLVTADYLVDVYRVTAEKERCLDWVMHCCGTFAEQDGMRPIGLAEGQGYHHLSDPQVHPEKSGWLNLPYVLDQGPAQVSMWLGEHDESQLIMAQDPDVDEKIQVGDKAPHQVRTCLMIRQHTASALFVSVWGFGDSPASGVSVTGDAGSDVTVGVQHDGETKLLTFDYKH